MNDVRKFIGNDNFTISEAMQRIDANGCAVLFIVDSDDLLVGCVSDGDIRRYLLSGGRMDDLIVRALNFHPRTAASFEEAKAICDGKDIVAVPVIDDRRKIIGVYIEDGETATREKPSLNTPVVINAGGKGTRLDPFTRVLPKPLIPVGDLPMIEHIMKEYQSYKCNEFHIIVNYKKELMKAYFSDNESHYDITWYDEEIPLGTGGGLTLLRGMFTDTFFFANCDALLTADYESMLKFHKENHNIITMVCAYKNLNIPYGVVEMGVDGEIEKMQEKPLMSFLTNTGIYIVEPEVIDDMEDGVAVGFPDVIEMQRQKGRKVAVFQVGENDWMDMGQLPELEKMRIKLYGE